MQNVVAQRPPFPAEYQRIAPNQHRHSIAFAGGLPISTSSAFTATTSSAAPSASSSSSSGNTSGRAISIPALHHKPTPKKPLAANPPPNSSISSMARLLDASAAKARSIRSNSDPFLQMINPFKRGKYCILCEAIHYETFPFISSLSLSLSSFPSSSLPPLRITTNIFIITNHTYIHPHKYP